MYKCDRCGAEMGTPKRIHVMGADDNPTLSMLNNTDLCAKCHEALVEEIDEFISYTPKSPKRMRMNTYEIQMAKALHGIAGWDADRIAKCMNKDVATVGMFIKLR